MVNLLRESGNLPVYYPGDGEVYLKAAKMQNGDTLVAFFNISLDPIDNIELVADRAVTKIERLTPEGKYAPVDFTERGGKLTLDLSANTLAPEILILK